MAIDLFVNYERRSNNVTFYRIISSSSTFTVRLSDRDTPEANLRASYYVHYSLNQQPSEEFLADENGTFALPLSIETQTPCICSITVLLTSLDTGITETLDMYGVFVNSFPKVDFIAYPSLFIDVDTGETTNINSSNYLNASKGLYFYGEGHTETINLSSNNYEGSGYEVDWLIGNTLYNIIDQKYTHSVYSIYSSDGINEATVKIPSVPDKEDVIPISVWATNAYITKTGPIITYDDYTGAEQFYPFFDSTAKNYGSRYKDNIKILRFPQPKKNIILTPFPDSKFLLPLDYSFRTFTATTISSKAYGGNVTEAFLSTQWELSIDVPQTNVVTWSVVSPVLVNCRSYQFELAYDSNTDFDNILVPFYKASSVLPTTITLTVSTQKIVSLNMVTDTIEKQFTIVDTVTAVVPSIPYSSIYAPKYFNIRGEGVPISIVQPPSPSPFMVLSAVLVSDKSSSRIVLTKDKPTETMIFNELGLVDITANVVLTHTKTKKIYNTTRTYNDFIEIVKVYDDEPLEEHFYTATTPLLLPYTEQPKITPNEWATADIVNNIFEKIYEVIQTLYNYSIVYFKKDKLYGCWMPSVRKQVSEDGEIINNRVLTWIDVNCALNSSLTQATWADYESYTPNKLLTWLQQTGNQDVEIISTVDKSCFQKHCVRWSWKWRKKDQENEIDITWKDTKRGERFSKKWAYEKCVIDTKIDCNQTKWIISTTEKKDVIIPYSTVVEMCTITDIDVLPSLNYIAFCYSRELGLMTKDHLGTKKDRTFMADDLFTFQNIVGLSVTQDEKVVVLDSILPRVSIFDIKDDNYILNDSWGKYGRQQNPLGLNQPRDIHIDKYNTVWIADTGNNCIRKYTITGKPLLTLTHSNFEVTPPLSMCVDSVDRLHCLVADKVLVFSIKGEYKFEYKLNVDAGIPQKINVSYNKEMVYVSHEYGVAKYFRTGTFSHMVLNNIVCENGAILSEYNSLVQDKFRNLYITVGDKLLQVQDLQHITPLKAPIKPELYWKLNDIKIHKEEYIQPWVYLKSFHRLWDNIELLRSSIFYSLDTKCKTHVPATYSKDDLIIGQNEIVTNSVLNRLSEQLWANLQSLIDYFNPDCEK